MSNRPRVSSASQQGFTLVELAISLFIIGLIFGGGFLVGSQYLKAQKITQTQAKIALIQNALSAYAQAHYRIPCPADPSKAPGALGYGIEKDANNCMKVDGSNTALMTETEGVVPWKELGIPQDDAVDGWNHYITYKPAPQLTVNNISTISGGGDEQDSNNVSANVQANASNPYIDIHNACRTPMWDDADGNHLKRGKALFCCNQAPFAVAPVTAYQSTNGFAGQMQAGWQQTGVTDTQSAKAGGGTAMPVAMTNNWHDADITNRSAASDGLHGSFVGYNSSKPQPPLMRATGLAVTLISHGGSGDLAFLPEQGGNGTYTLFGGATLNGTTLSNSNDAAVKQDSITSPQIFAGVFGHPKVSDSSFNLLNNNGTNSDEIVTYLRSDDLYGRVGTDSCQRPPQALPPEPCTTVPMLQSPTLYQSSKDGTAITIPTINLKPLTDAPNHFAGLSTVAQRLTDDAGYNNTLGVYTIAADGSIQNVQFLAANMHASAVGQSVSTTEQLSQSAAAVGTFIIANGYSINNSYQNVDMTSLQYVYDFGQADQRAANIGDTDPTKLSMIGKNTQSGAYVQLTGEHDGAGGTGVMNMYSNLNYADTDHFWTAGNVASKTVLPYAGVSPTDPTVMDMGFEDLSSVNCYLTYTSAGATNSSAGTTCSQTQPPPKPANSTTHAKGDAVLDQYGGYEVSQGDNDYDDVAVGMQMIDCPASN